MAKLVTNMHTMGDVHVHVFGHVPTQFHVDFKKAYMHRNRASQNEKQRETQTDEFTHLNFS